MVMSPSDITQNLNDPWAQAILVPNAGPKPGWPTTFNTIVSAVERALPSFRRSVFMVGEGSQIPISRWPATKDRDLRVVIAWADEPALASIYFSADPPQPPALETLEVIAFDSKKNKLNYYHYVDATGSGSADPLSAKTWIWAGDSSLARDPRTIGKACFACHLNGGLTLKELEKPWNNWDSFMVKISPDVFPAEVASNPLFKTLESPTPLQGSLLQMNGSLMTHWVDASLEGSGPGGTPKRARNVPELLRRLIETTTIRLASTETTSASTDDITKLPADFFLFDTALHDIIGLKYTMPTFNIRRDHYASFMAAYDVRLVSDDGDAVPGSTFFAFFVPAPAAEDVMAIRALIKNAVISPKFAAAVLMVDFQNPVFSPGRASLMRYAEQIPTGAADGASIPSQFASLVGAVAKTQPSCDATRLSQCTAEQQFLYFWNQPDATWKSVVQGRVKDYLAAVQSRLPTEQGTHDILKLMISRGVQFASYPLVCNLHESELLFPQTSLGRIFVQMNPDGLIRPQPSYNACPGEEGR